MPSADEHRECDRNASRRRLLLARVLGELTAAIFSMFSRRPGGSAAESWGGHSESFDPARLPASDGQLHCLQARMTGPPPPQVVADVERTPSDRWDRNRFPPSDPTAAFRSWPGRHRRLPPASSRGDVLRARRRCCVPRLVRRCGARVACRVPQRHSHRLQVRVPLNRTRARRESGQARVRTGSPPISRSRCLVACLVACQKCHLIARRVISSLDF